MLSRFLVAVAAAALAFAGEPAQENLVANLPTSSNANDVFQYTQDGSTWIDVTNEKRIGFTNGIAGWKIKGDESSEVVYTVASLFTFCTLNVKIDHGPMSSTAACSRSTVPRVSAVQTCRF